MARWKREITDPVTLGLIDRARYDRDLKTKSGHIFSEFSEFAWMRGRMRDLYDTYYGQRAYTHYSCDLEDRIRALRSLPPIPLP